jgi:hypothetical protein
VENLPAWDGGLTWIVKVSDLAAILGGAGIGLVIVVPLLWRNRQELKQGWGQALGIIPRASAPPSKATAPPKQAAESSQLATAALVTLGVLVTVGSVMLAIQTSDVAVRVVNIVVAVVTVLGLHVFLRERLP